MSANNTRPFIPKVTGQDPVSKAVNKVIDRSGTGAITLRASQTTTTLTDPKITVFSHIDLMPTTANAGAAKASASYYVVTTDGSATVHHASNAAVDQTFTYQVSN